MLLRLPATSSRSLTFSLIFAALNNNTIYYSNSQVVPMQHAIVIPDGSWTVDTLNKFLTNTQQAQVGQTIFNIVPNTSNDLCVIQFENVTGWFVNIPANNSVIGFNAGNYPVNFTNTAYQLVYAQNTARFNSIDQINVSCNLTNDSISNTQRSSVIHVCTPTVSTGSTQTSMNYNLLWLAAPMLSCKTTDLSISLTDQNGLPIVMTEDFSLTLAIRTQS
jgi:hypothetical protein